MIDRNTEIGKETEACLKTDFLSRFGSVEDMKTALIRTMLHTIGKDPSEASTRDWFYTFARLLRGVLSQRHIKTARNHYKNGSKKVYYLSMEYLMGRSLNKVLLDLGIEELAARAMEDFGLSLNDIKEIEFDAALGNGGLGRLAACFLDSLATHNYPGFGYGIRYEYGIFTQDIKNGQQVEHPENWLRYGNPWEVERPDILYPVHFGGRISCFKNAHGAQECHWVDTEEVMAMAFDVPISGYGTNTVGNLRLWSSRATRDFNLRYFNEGDYEDAVREKTSSENLSKVLYPNDKTQLGKELRLKQEFFFVSASLQDIIARHLRYHDSLDDLPDLTSMQLNDTHPALAVPELMRLLMDVHNYTFEAAWAICVRTFSYTNHTLLSEALETWPINMMSNLLPRHLDLIFKINDEFLRKIRHTFPGDPAILRRLSLIDDDRHAVRMAHLSIVGSHKVNGVAALHTQLLRSNMFPDFDRLYPDKFINMTNGITPRRWLLQSNPGLSTLISEHIGNDWMRDLSQLTRLAPMADDAAFRERFIAIKRENKVRLGNWLQERFNTTINVDSLFDMQVKRIHEYKRQLLNVLHVITLYNRMCENPAGHHAARTIFFAGKAAPGYDMAKLIIHLINDVAETVNNNPVVSEKLKILFVPNYSVSQAEILIPASDLSEQISTAGTEASGTGNMKFALNGALTIGTLDGANIEIKEEVGGDNIFIFGMNAEEVQSLRMSGYDPWARYNENAELKRCLDMIGSGYFSPDDQGRYRPIVDSLLRGGDHYMLLADYASYVQCQETVARAHRDTHDWARRAILNVVHMGKFSADRTIHDYAREIWNIHQIES
ncbi:MAG: glycogen/starch/alpha-glucan phosphorylase [Rhodospirillales bacterium]|nr:glycogen/starch/alpha-glucan phosphorylase [Rhodospirillales bacterium]